MMDAIKVLNAFVVIVGDPNLNRLESGTLRQLSVLIDEVYRELYRDDLERAKTSANQGITLVRPGNDQ